MGKVMQISESTWAELVALAKAGSDELATRVLQVDTAEECGEVMRELGRRTSEVKAAAVRANGARGGRPRKR